MDPARTAETARQNQGLVVGVKVAHYAGPDWVPYERAVEAGKAANIPVMVDFAEFRPERPFQELVLHKLRPGDIYTHTYLSAVPMLDDQGLLLPYLFEARKRGIIFDLGHGGGSFSWRQAVPAVRQGFVPDSISTDLHVSSSTRYFRTIPTPGKTMPASRLPGKRPKGDSCGTDIRTWAQRQVWFFE